MKEPLTSWKVAEKTQTHTHKNTHAVYRRTHKISQTCNVPTHTDRQKSILTNKLTAAHLFEFLLHTHAHTPAHTNKHTQTKGLNAAIQTKTQMHCALSQAGNNS